jgi:hypothetical protein
MQSTLFVFFGNGALAADKAKVKNKMKAATSTVGASYL